MATVVLSTAASSAGLSGFAAVGAQLGAAVVGGLIDNALFGPPDTNQEGPRLGELQISTSSEGLLYDACGVDPGFPAMSYGPPTLKKLKRLRSKRG